jgi:predicted AAA+ superfamily ATPase
LLAGLAKYSADVVRQRASSPKFQVHNTALLTAQQDGLFEEIRRQPADWGRWVESAVGAHLLQGALSDSYRLFYWRDRDREVDFVLEKGDQIVALEVKSGPTSSSPGLDAFRKQFQTAKPYLIGPSGIPWETFLSIDPLELF